MTRAHYAPTARSRKHPNGVRDAAAAPRQAGRLVSLTDASARWQAEGPGMRAALCFVTPVILAVPAQIDGVNPDLSLTRSRP